MGKVESAAEEGGIGTNGVYSALAAAILGLHLLFILWIVFGAALTRRRPLLRAASWFLSVGYPDRNPALDLPLNLGGKLPGDSGRDCAVPGWIPAALSRRVDLSEHSTWVAHRPGGCRVCRQSRHLCSPFPASRARRLVGIRWLRRKHSKGSDIDFSSSEQKEKRPARSHAKSARLGNSSICVELHLRSVI